MRLNDRVHLIASGQNGLETTDPGDCNCYLLETSVGALLIDAGGGRRLDLIQANIERCGHAADSIAAILLTHTHYDHVAGAAQLKQWSAATLVASEESAARLAAGDEESMGLRACRRAGFYSADARLEPVTVDVVVAERQALTFGDVSILPIHTPGHASDHVSYLTTNGSEQMLFSGDFLFPGGKISLVALPDCRLEQYLHSLTKFRGERIDSFFPGHLAPVLSGGAAHFDIALARLDRLAIPENI